MVFLCFAPMQPHDGVQVLHLPRTPLVQRAIHGGVVVAAVDEQHFVAQVEFLALVEEP